MKTTNTLLLCAFSGRFCYPKRCLPALLHQFSCKIEKSQCWAWNRYTLFKFRNFRLFVSWV